MLTRVFENNHKRTLVHPEVKIHNENVVEEEESNVQKEHITPETVLGPSSDMHLRWQREDDTQPLIENNFGNQPHPELAGGSYPTESWLSGQSISTTDPYGLDLSVIDTLPWDYVQNTAGLDFQWLV
jgi:hypothetical protein